MIGNIVNVKVDRPLGSFHPKHKDIYYPINYGYIEGIITVNEDTLLYGVEVKFYNMEVEVDEHLESKHKGLYIIGDRSGITHSLSRASASGVHVARNIVQ